MYVALVPHGWCRDEDPVKALKDAYRHGSFSGTNPSAVLVKVTGDDEPYVNGMGGICHHIDAEVEVAHQGTYRQCVAHAKSL